MHIVPIGGILGARVEGLDLAGPVADATFRALEQALGRHGVLCYPRQTLTSGELKAFAERFGTLEINVANVHQEPGLPDELKSRLSGMTVTHDFAKFWDKMRLAPGSTRKPLTEAQRAAKPPVSHPVFLTHPITGRRVLYANPGYAMRINELPADESSRILEFLFAHQLQQKYQYKHHWQAGDVLMWDNIGTIHNAVPDYGPHEHRYIKRCQVMADRYFAAGTA